MAINRRYDPFSDMLSLRDAVSQLFEDSVVSPARNNRTVPMNVSETPDGYHVEVELPGFKPEDVDITLHDNILTIRGEAQQAEQRENTNFHLIERRYGSFSRSISLPAAVNSDSVNATMEHGVLTLDVPKADEVKPRKITVGSRDNSKTLDVEPAQERAA